MHARCAFNRAKAENGGTHAADLLDLSQLKSAFRGLGIDAKRRSLAKFVDEANAGGDGEGGEGGEGGGERAPLLSQRSFVRMVVDKFQAKLVQREQRTENTDWDEQAEMAEVSPGGRGGSGGRGGGGVPSSPSRAAANQCMLVRANSMYHVSHDMRGDFDAVADGGDDMEGGGGSDARSSVEPRSIYKLFESFGMQQI